MPASAEKEWEVLDRLLPVYKYFAKLSEVEDGSKGN